MRLKIVFFFSFFLSFTAAAQPWPEHNLTFDSLANRWDEAMPLGNGMLGALIWKKGDRLRFSLDRADLWDERQALDLDRFNFRWVQQQVEKKQYDTVQKLGDDPYEASPYPTKIPAGALEFDISKYGPVRSNILDISKGINTLVFKNGMTCKTYIHANKPYGYFDFDHVTGDLVPQLVIPEYTGAPGKNGNSVEGQGLQQLGYAKGQLTMTKNGIRYHQPTTAGNYYEIFVAWKKITATHVTGYWTISVNAHADQDRRLSNSALVAEWADHIHWWRHFWNQSSISIPDKQLEKQYYLEMYKLGCVARKGAPAITLQAIWTADNGNLPPWKGDFHNDLNTQLSYWPCYTSNHLAEAATFTDWLWNIRTENKKYTGRYFGVGGLNVPGVVTLHGQPMGGWIQYSLSPTVGAWLAQHFYWQWKYSMDKDLLIQKVYPYLHELAVFVSEITFLKDGKRKLPLSSSPEYHDNSINAWFTDWTNYDLALVKFLFKAAAEVSDAAGKNNEAKKWRTFLGELPAYTVNETGLAVAPGENLEVSHRHLSPYMAIFPLGLLHVANAPDSEIIERSLQHIRQKGTGEWCGYSFSWMASVYARTRHADSAAKMLRIFASNFCSINSFHVNGDQGGGGYSHFTYRPFTLEGNFAYARGLQEMLLQSEEGFIEVLPASPADWKNISFKNFRTEGAFLVSLEKKEGRILSVSLRATQNGTARLKIPFSNFYFSEEAGHHTKDGGMLTITLKKNETLVLMNRDANQ